MTLRSEPFIRAKLGAERTRTAVSVPGMLYRYRLRSERLSLTETGIAA